MIPAKVKSLIDRYCMGVKPSEEQIKEIKDVLNSCIATEIADVLVYMRKMIYGLTNEKFEINNEEQEKKRTKLHMERFREELIREIIQAWIDSYMLRNEDSVNLQIKNYLNI